MKRADLEKILKELENSKEVIDQIMEWNGQDINAQKAKTEAMEASVKEIEGQLAEANKTIEDMKALDPEGLQKKADEWKTQAEKFQKDAETAKAEADQRVNQLKFDTALSDALKEANAKDPKDIIPHLDTSILKLEETGEIAGLSEQLTKLQEGKDYLFNSKEERPKFVKKTDGHIEPTSAFEQGIIKGAKNAGVDMSEK